VSLAISHYLPTPAEIEAEARIFEREGAESGPLHALLVERIRLKMLVTEFKALIADYRKMLAEERKFDLAKRR
jgi:hypothetical protein